MFHLFLIQRSKIIRIGNAPVYRDREGRAIESPIIIPANRASRGYNNGLRINGKSSVNKIIQMIS